MYLVNSRREASLLIPESQPVAVSSVAQRLQDQVTPSLFALWERAKSAVAVLPEEPPAQEMPEGEAAIVSEMQQVPLEQEPPSDPSVINGVIAKGDSASELLSPYMSASSVQQLLNVTRKLHPLNNLRTGQPYTLVCSPDGRDMERFEYEINDRKKLIVTKTDEGLVAHVEPIVYDFSLVRVSGTIRSSLFETLASTGESPILAVRIADIFGSEINFIKDLREGDSFSLLIEKRFRENEFKGYGKVLGATFTNQGKTYEAYNFATEDGEAFFNAKGESLKKTLLKAPLAFTRISSGYSMNRKHPILKHISRIRASITRLPPEPQSRPSATARSKRPGGGTVLGTWSFSSIPAGWSPCIRIFPGLRPVPSAGRGSGRGRSSAMWAQPDMPPARIWISASSRTVNT